MEKIILKESKITGRLEVKVSQKIWSNLKKGRHIFGNRHYEVQNTGPKIYIGKRFYKTKWTRYNTHILYKLIN